MADGRKIDKRKQNYHERHGGYFRVTSKNIDRTVRAVIQSGIYTCQMTEKNECNTLMQSLRYRRTNIVFGLGLHSRMKRAINKQKNFSLVNSDQRQTEKIRTTVLICPLRTFSVFIGKIRTSYVTSAHGKIRQKFRP